MGNRSGGSVENEKVLHWFESGQVRNIRLSLGIQKFGALWWSADVPYTKFPAKIVYVFVRDKQFE